MGEYKERCGGSKEECGVCEEVWGNVWESVWGESGGCGEVCWGVGKVRVEAWGVGDDKGRCRGGERVYGVSVGKGVRVWADVERGVGKCRGRQGESVEKCIGVWGEVKGDVGQCMG